ncbi:zinc finger protein 169 [Lentinula edodes]|uniref:Zinc finger protein 169 n=1 Tax=Lentinula edodes TaxID=5353 RepID=A0A1Q3ELS0_LENED|nr:zinc finger protein 169 [Lentinula edodes]
MPLKAVLRGNSLENTPNSSDQQQPSRSEHDGSDDSGGSSVSAEFTELCTEDCHLITCADPTHEAANCTASGDTLVCPDPKDCNVVDKYLQYCYPGPNQSTLPKYPDDYPKEYIDMYAHSFPNTSESAAERASDSSRSESASSRSVTPPFSMEGQEHLHQCKGSHMCRWNGCGLTFDSCDDLTTHLTQAHVGSGKPHYDCYWGECVRNGQSGFTSKQKICRHLQSHTGHRPFQCNLCHQNFSEAATLQQHMRRHTREKPYACDHPGCGKSFAITGALTIHKRTHNGYKPFKCTFCDRAFAESSNLSKHLRTHTGARPYSCLEPGCNKSFARPDQLTRHGNVHRKKAQKAAAA